MSYDRRPRASRASVMPRRPRTRNAEPYTDPNQPRFDEDAYLQQLEEVRRAAAAEEARRAREAAAAQQAANQQARQQEAARREAARRAELAQQQAIAAAYQSAAGNAQAQRQGQMSRQSVAASAQQRSASTASGKVGGAPSMAPSGAPMNLPKVGGMKGRTRNGRGYSWLPDWGIFEGLTIDTVEGPVGPPPRYSVGPNAGGGYVTAEQSLVPYQRQQEREQQQAIAAAWQRAEGNAQAQRQGQMSRQSVAAAAQQRSASTASPSGKVGGAPSMAPSAAPTNLPKVGAGMKGGYRKLHTFADPRTANPNYRPRHDYEDDEFEVSRAPIRTPRHVKIDPLTALTHIDRSADRDRERRERSRRASKRAANPPMRNYSLDDIEEKFGKAERRIASKMCDNGNCFMVFGLVSRGDAPLYVKDFRAASRVAEDIGTGATIAEIFARMSNPRGPRR